MLKLSVPMLIAVFATATASTAAPARKTTSGKPGAKAKAPVTPTVRSLAITPDRVALDGPTAQQHLLVTATLSNGARKDVTSQVKWTSSAAKVATVADSAVRPHADGQAVLLAKLGTASAKLTVAATGTQRPVAYSFANDVVPVLSRLGCSQGTCHGANSGKGGFKLSLRGYAPELDFLSITRQLGGRRIAREAPEQSLLLRKPLMETAHAGGKALIKGSREYYTLLGWLYQGAPGVDEKEPQVTGLQLLPGTRTYQPKEQQRLLAMATYSDGRVVDVTDRAIFRTNDAAVAEVSTEGEIKAQSPGSTAVMAKYGELLASLTVTVPYAQKISTASFPAPANYVDQHLQAKWKELNLEPSPVCTDEEFLRRAYTDVLGTLPTVDEAKAFLDSTDPQKREKLIDTVLKRPEYASLWALRLCDLSMIRKEHQGRKNTVAIHQWITEQFLANRPWDQLVTDLVAASGDIEENPATLWWASRQMTRPNSRGWVRHYELTGEIVAQVFLGQRIQCAKCHNHPTEKFTQDDYYHFAALFAQVNGDGPADPIPQRFLANDKGEVRHPRTGQVMKAQPLDHTDLKVAEGEDRRIKFAQWLTGAGKDVFGRNIVNRLWARLFGQGIVDPVDDLRSTNPPKSEALMNALVADLVDHKWDLKYLIGVIMRSKAYQASSVPVPNNKIDTQFFTRYPVRRLQGEELMDAIAQVTGVPDRFASYPVGTRAIELTDTELNSTSLDTFGRPPRTTPCECDRSSAPSISQALELYNGEALQQKLKSGDGRVAQLARSGKPDAAIVEELFLATFSRRPNQKEREAVLGMLPPPDKPAEAKMEVLQDLLWALINSKEFMFHH